MYSYIHGLYYLPDGDGDAAVSAARRALPIVLINQAATSIDATLPPSDSHSSSATCSCLRFFMRRRVALRGVKTEAAVLASIGIRGEMKPA
jgi:hypothetical protein